jgi:hypothetical protein
MMIRGNCTDDENPDAWFPELPVGNPSRVKMQALGIEVSRAIVLCNSCHNQDECLEEGMKPKNLPYGIWGGKLAGERILMADRQGMEYMSKGRATGALVKPDIAERVGRGRHKGSVVIKENDSVTVEEKRRALSFFQAIKPWIKG